MWRGLGESLSFREESDGIVQHILSEERYWSREWEACWQQALHLKIAWWHMANI